MGKRGPAPIQINWEEFDKLVGFQCTQEELADFFNCDVDTLNNACIRDRGEKLSDVWRKKKNAGRTKLRKLQFQIVERGGPGAATMAIYLDKKMNPTENPDRPPDPPGKPAVLPAVKSFEEFCEAARYPRPYPVQVEMAAFGVDGIPYSGEPHPGGLQPRMLLGARGYGKTDYVTILKAAYKVFIEGPLATILIVSKSKTRNTAMIQEIASALKANGVELEKENASVIRIAGLIGKDHSVEAVTIKTSMRGRHPKLVILDDPVTEEDVSEAMRLLVKRKYNEIMKLCSNVVVIGQPAHAYDLYSELRPMVRKMEVPHGTIPELDHDLEAQRLAGVDEKSIQASYFLKITPDGEIPFANIKLIDRFPNGDCVAFIDPSDGGDYTAVSILRMIGDGVVAVQGHAWKRPWFHCVDDMVTIFRARGVRKIGFETNVTGSQPVEQLRQIPLLNGVGVVGIHSTTQKHSTIMSAGSYSHLIHLSRESDRVYTDQVTKYEKGAKFDDAPDSLARGLEWLGLVRGKR